LTSFRTVRTRYAFSGAIDITLYVTDTVLHSS